MELKLKNINVCNYSRKISTVCSVEADIIVPDTKPDIYKILCVNAVVCVDEHYIRKEKMIFSGNVKFTVLYTGDTDKSRIYSIAYSVPFNHQCDAQGADDNYTSVAGFSVASTDFKIKNSRKLSAISSLNLYSEILEFSETDVLDGVIGDDAVPTKEQKITSDYIVSSRNVGFMVSESICVPLSGSNCDVLDFSGNINSVEIKSVNNKAIIKGNLPVKILYMTDSEPCVYETEFSFTEITDLDEATGDSKLNWNFCISDISYELSENDSEINIDFDIKVDGYIKAYENGDYTLTSDIYSPDFTYNVKKSEFIMQRVENLNETQITVKDNLSTDTDGIFKVYYMSVYPDCKKAVCESGSLKLSGSAQTTVIYSDTDEIIHSIKKDIPFDMEFPVDYEYESGEFTSVIHLLNYGYVLTGNDEIQARIILGGSASVNKNYYINTISDFNQNMSEPIDKSSQASITVCYPMSGDSLWDYAVKYNTTVQEIIVANSLTDEESFEIGAPLVIPKRKR